MTNEVFFSTNAGAFINFSNIVAVLRDEPDSCRAQHIKDAFKAVKRCLYWQDVIAVVDDGLENAAYNRDVQKHPENYCENRATLKHNVATAAMTTYYHLVKSDVFTRKPVGMLGMTVDSTEYKSEALFAVKALVSAYEHATGGDIRKLRF